MRLALACILSALPLVVACNNPCQRICTRMADYAEECGLEVSASDLDACKANQATDEALELKPFCRDFNDRASIESEWTCDEVAFYWNTTAPETGEDNGESDDTDA